MKRFTSRTFIAFALLSGTAVVSMDMAVAAETTQASWYGPGFHGRKTASGEAFNQNAMTAAHKTRRLGSTVKVTNVATGKSVVVKIFKRWLAAQGATFKEGSKHTKVYLNDKQSSLG